MHQRCIKLEGIAQDWDGDCQIMVLLFRCFLYRVWASMWHLWQTEWQLTPCVTPQKPRELFVEEVLLQESRGKAVLIWEPVQERILLDRIWVDRRLKKLMLDWGTDLLSATVWEQFSSLTVLVYSHLVPLAVSVKCCIWWLFIHVWSWCHSPRSCMCIPLRPVDR